jgi:hypothetical protein
MIFLAATLAPLALTVWVTTSLLEESIDISSTSRLDTLSKSLTRTAREFYQRAREDLKRDAETGQVTPRKYTALDRATWPDEVKVFSGGREGDRFVRSGQDGTSSTTWCGTTMRSGSIPRASAMWRWTVWRARSGTREAR